MPRSQRSLHLERASIDDAVELTELYHTAYAPLADAGMNFTATYQDVEHTRSRFDRGEIFVARDHGRIVATIAIRERPATTDGPRHLYVGKLAVAPGAQRQGLGSYLLEFAEQEAKMRGIHAVKLDTAKPARELIDWYRRRGYDAVGETHWPGKTYDSVVLVKPI